MKFLFSYLPYENTISDWYNLLEMPIVCVHLFFHASFSLSLSVFIFTICSMKSIQMNCFPFFFLLFEAQCLIRASFCDAIFYSKVKLIVIRGVGNFTILFLYFAWLNVLWRCSTWISHSNSKEMHSKNANNRKLLEHCKFRLTSMQIFKFELT